MATITKTESGKWKGIIRKSGWPTSVKTFRLKKDAEDWARRTEDEMVRGIFAQRAPAERMTLNAAPKTLPERGHTHQAPAIPSQRSAACQAALPALRQILPRHPHPGDCGATPRYAARRTRSKGQGANLNPGLQIRCGSIWRCWDTCFR